MEERRHARGGTSLVKDIVPGGGGSAPVNLTTVGNQVFFSAQEWRVPPQKASLGDERTGGGYQLGQRFSTF